MNCIVSLEGWGKEEEGIRRKGERERVLPNPKHNFTGKIAKIKKNWHALKCHKPQVRTEGCRMEGGGGGVWKDRLEHTLLPI